MQTNKDLYQKDETIIHMFTHSCLGQLFILFAIVAIVAVVAMFTVPSEQDMISKVSVGIRQCIESNYDVKGDKIDDAVRNLSTVFSVTDSLAEDTYMDDFHRYNTLEVREHTLYSTVFVRNNLSPSGIRVGIGLFGMVFPTVSFDDMILRAGPVRREYNQRILKTNYAGEDLGNNPDFGDTYDTYQGGGSGGE